MVFYERTYGVGIRYNGEDAFLAYPPDEDGIYVSDFLYDLASINRDMDNNFDSNEDFFKHVADDFEVKVYENDEEFSVGLYITENEEDYETAMDYTVLNAQVTKDRVEIFNLIINEVEDVDREKQMVVVFPEYMAEGLDPETGELSMNPDDFENFTEFFSDLDDDMIVEFPDGRCWKFSYTA